MNIEALFDAFVTLPGGLLLTLLLTIAPLIAGFLLSLPLALARASDARLRSLPVFAYTYMFRGTPLLVQLFIVYYGLAQLPLIRHGALWPVFRDPFWCAFIAFTLNSAAHTTEIFAGGFRAVPKGQIEAGQALGFSQLQTLYLIRFPLAFRIVLPAYTNEVIGMLKASSLGSTVTLLEVTGLSRQLVAATFAPYEVFVVAGLIYLAVTLVITALARSLERYLAPTSHALTIQSNTINRFLRLSALRTGRTSRP
jgi:octopine/nopaline transport system permease protein